VGQPPAKVGQPPNDYKATIWIDDGGLAHPCAITTKAAAPFAGFDGWAPRRLPQLLCLHFPHGTNGLDKYPEDRFVLPTLAKTQEPALSGVEGMRQPHAWSSMLPKTLSF